MRLGRLLLLVAVVLVVGVGAIYFVSTQNRAEPLTPEQAQATTEAQTTVPVVYLIQPVGRGQQINMEQLSVQQVPLSEVKDVRDLYYESPGEVAGKLARADLTQGEYISSDMVVDSLDSSDLGSEHASLIPVDFVAFPVPVNRFSSVAYGLTRGDRVDIIVTLAFVDMDTQFQSITPNYTAGVISPGSNLISASEGASLTLGEFFANQVAQTSSGGTSSIQGRAELDALLDTQFYYVPSEAQRPRVVSQMIMQNLRVLNMGTFPILNADGEPINMATPTPVGEEPPPEDEAVAPAPPVIEPPDIITLVMRPQDAVTLNYLIYTGARITLALRSAGDDSIIPTNAVTLQYLMDEYQIPVPVRLPYGTQPRIDVLVDPVLENDAEDGSAVIQ
ncbi:MAG TPA: SAF domain-containing protein [Anaerolineales bacterium]|nr:SAF domain-containing protein [Anaerolineales bacterium]